MITIYKDRTPDVVKYLMNWSRMLIHCDNHSAQNTRVHGHDSIDQNQTVGHPIWQVGTGNNSQHILFSGMAVVRKRHWRTFYEDDNKICSLFRVECAQETTNAQKNLLITNQERYRAFIIQTIRLQKAFKIGYIITCRSPVSNYTSANSD